jgi:hypothetical protein
VTRDVSSAPMTTRAPNLVPRVRECLTTAYFLNSNYATIAARDASEEKTMSRLSFKFKFHVTSASTV